MILYTVRRVVKYESETLLGVMTDRRRAMKFADKAGGSDFLQIPMPRDSTTVVYVLQNRLTEDVRIIVDRIVSDGACELCPAF
jgi:hypothetical protein